MFLSGMVRWSKRDDDGKKTVKVDTAPGSHAEKTKKQKAEERPLIDNLEAP